MSALEYEEPSNSLIASINYPNGYPYVFATIAPDGAPSQFSGAADYTDEVEMAAVRPGYPTSFQVGDIFTGNGTPGQIVRITNGGNTVISPWTTLTTTIANGSDPALPNGPYTETGLLRGDLYVDETGVFGGNLIVATTTGHIWEVTPQGQTTLLVDLNNPNVNPNGYGTNILEGVLTVPDCPSCYGPLSGDILASWEDGYGSNGGIWAINPSGQAHYYELNLPELESINLIPANENFYGVDYGDNQIVGAPASDFDSMAGDILVTQESGGTGSELYRLHYDGTNLDLTPIVLTAGSVIVTHWEHVTFAPTGILPLPVPPQPTPLPNWTVYLDIKNEGHYDPTDPTTVTDANGDYSFTGLTPGTYTVAELPQSGWEQTSPDLGAPWVVTVAGGQVLAGVDFTDTQTTPSTTDPGPTFTSTVPKNAQVNQKLTYAAAAYDPDGDTVKFDLPVAPMGMVVDPITGLVVWTPTANQVGFQNVVLRATDSNGYAALQTFSIAVSPPATPPTFLSPSTITECVNDPVTFLVHALDGNGYPINYTATGLPGTLSLGLTSGLLTGSVPTAGTYTATITANDQHGGIATQTLTLVVTPDSTPAKPNVSPPVRLSAVVGETYFGQVLATDPSGLTLTYATDASDPTNLSINPATGLITWTPTAAQLGYIPVTIHVTDCCGATNQVLFDLYVAGSDVNGLPTITSTPPEVAAVNQVYRYNLQGNDSDGDPLLWSLDSAPTGMAIDPTSGILLWTPTAAQSGTFSVTVRLTDAQGADCTQTYPILVYPADIPPRVDNDPPTSATVGYTYVYDPVVDSPFGPLTFTAGAGDPTNFSVNPTTGEVIWVPNANQVGSQTVTLVITDSYPNTPGVTDETYTILVGTVPPGTPPSITPVTPPGAVVSVPYSFQFQASDADGSTPTYALAGTLPPGLSMSSGGLLSGTPTAQPNPNPTPLTLTVTDDHGLTAQETFSLLVIANNPPIITPIANASVTAGLTYRYDVQATDPAGSTLTYSIATSPNTPGLTIDPSLGRITWATSPSNAGASVTITVTVKDAFNLPSSKTYTLNVVAETQPPSVAIEYPGATIPGQGDINTSVAIQVLATDPVAVTSMSLTVGGASVLLDADGIGHVSYATVQQNLAVVATATNAGNVQGHANGTLTIINPAITGSPTATLLAQSSTFAATNDVNRTTGQPTFDAIAIGPNSSATSTITVDDTATLEHLTLALNIADASNAGLLATLTGPNNAVVTLFSNVAGAGFSNTTFDDSAATSIQSATPPFTNGTYKPKQALSAVEGGQAFGTYTLTITNASMTNTATLTGWSMTYTKPTGSDVTAPVQIYGTVSDPTFSTTNPGSYTLTATPVSGGATTTLGGGTLTASIVDADLGTFDPTVLANGMYDIVLSATNAGGISTSVDQTVTVKGNLKLGDLDLSFADLTVPVAGIPITITRTYDSLDADTQGDFGYGWTLSETDYQLEVEAGSYGQGSNDPTIPFVNGTRVLVTRPDGTIEGFTFAPTGEDNVFGIPYDYQPAFTPDPGVTDQLTVPPVDGDLTYDASSGYYISGLSDDPYNPANSVFGGSYTLTDPTGLATTFYATTGQVFNRVRPARQHARFPAGRDLLQ